MNNNKLTKTNQKAIIYDIDTLKYFNYIKIYNIIDYRRILDTNNPYIVIN